MHFYTLTCHFFVQKLLEAHEEQNSEAFTEAVSSEIYLYVDLLFELSYCAHMSFVLLIQVKEFDSISRLDQWQTTMLLRIKKTIQGDAGDLK